MFNHKWFHLLRASQMRVAWQPCWPKSICVSWFPSSLFCWC